MWPYLLAFLAGAGSLLYMSGGDTPSGESWYYPDSNNITFGTLLLAISIGVAVYYVAKKVM